MLSSTRALHGQRRISRLLAVLMCASLLLSSVAAAPYTPTARQDLPAPTTQVPDDASRVNYHQIVIKFKPETGARLRPEGFVAAAGDLSGIQQTLQELDVKRLFTATEESLETNRVSALAEGAPYAPDLNLYYLVQLAEEVSFEDAQAILAAIQADPSVELAYMEPIYSPASRAMIVEDYTDQQIYLQDSTVNGIDALYARAQSGGRGDGVRVIDVENGWQIGHEDLPISSSSLIESFNSPDRYFVDHGSAVLGIIAARDNNPAIGVTGIAPRAELRLVSTITNPTADAINKAALNSRPGDIIVLPIQALGPVPSEEFCPAGCDCSAFANIPVEYWQGNFDAIYAATQAGIIVVEAAGNGAVNLDHARYGGVFNRASRDSGALLVGAGSSLDRSPVCDANYGKRIDLQGWGDSVVTTGFGDLNDGGGDPNQFYTGAYGGSSAASAMVAGAAASLQGIAKNRGYLLYPAEMRSILRSTGTAQTGDPALQPIGPLPNLRKAIETKLTENVTLLTPADDSDVHSLYPTLDWQDYFSASQYELVIASNSNFDPIALSAVVAGTEYTVGTALSNNRTYYWRVRPMVEGVWQPFSHAFAFTTRAISVPAVPILGPATGATTANFTPTFTWKTVTVAEGYEIQIDKTADFSVVDPEETFDTSFNPDPALDENSRYYWRVRAFIGDLPNRSYSRWSPARVLYTGLDITPAAPAVIAADGTERSLRPLMDWSDVPLARAYLVQTSLSSTFASVLRSDQITLPAGQTEIPSEYRTPTALPRGRTVYWRVRVKGTYTWSTWLTGDSIDTGTPPGVPTLVSPANKAIGGTYEDSITLIWLKPTLLPESYEIQVATDKDFSNLVVEDVAVNPVPGDPILKPNYNLTGLEPESIYYWRVRSVNLDGDTSLWSAYRVLYTTPPVPTALDVQAPVDSLRPTLLWDKVDLARSYNIQIARDNPLQPDKAKLFTSTRILASFTTLTNPPVISTTTLPRRTDVVWRVRSGGVYGYSAWSDIASFTTPNSPATPVLVSPANGAELRAFTPLLDWNPSVKISGNPESNAVGYQIQITDNTLPASATLDVTEDLTVTSYRIPMDLLPTAGRYYWRVRAVNDPGDYSVWSPYWSFVTPSIVTGTVTDALTGDPIPNVTIQINGRTIQTNTGADGTYSLTGLPTGSYTIVTSASGYMRQVVDVSSTPGLARTRDIALAPIPDAGSIRIALTWDASPANLDAYLWLPPTNPVVINKDNEGDETDPTISAQFYREDSDGWGPEIITISGTFPGTYQFGAYMVDAAAEQFVNTRGRVTVYDGPKLLATYTIPAEGIGKWWKVFTLDGTKRTVTRQNVITSTRPGSY